MADSNTMTEDVKDAWDEDKAKDYPVQDFDDTAAEDDPTNSAGFIGGDADMRPKLKTGDEPDADQPDTETTGEKTEPQSDEPEADSEPSDTVEPSAEPDDDASEVDAGLTSRIKEAGLSDLSDLSEAQLEKVLTHMQRAEDRALLRPEPEKPEARSSEPEPEPEEFKIELDPEYQDPEVIKAFKALDQRHQAQNNKLQQQIEQLNGHMREQARQAYQDNFDSWVNALPTEYAELLGTGPTNEMDENGTAFKQRNEVALAADAMEARIIQNGNTPPNRRAMLKRGLYAILGDKATQIERTVEKKKDAKRRSRTTAMPTHKRERDPQQPLGDRAAHDWVRGWMQKEGITAALNDGLPSGQEEGI